MNSNLLGEKWYSILKEEFDKPYFLQLKQTLKEEYQKGKVYPKPSDIFRVFQVTDPTNIRCAVILQDPYPFGGHAHGVALSSLQEETPFSLQIVLRELDRDIFHTKSKEEFKTLFPNNNLEPWCKKGIMMLNACLTVRAGEPNSHNNIGWQQFTKSVVQYLWNDKQPKAFLLLGNDAAQLMEDFVREGSPHKILEVGHPATAAKGKGKDVFSGKRVFSQVNHWFWKQGLEEINWSLNN